MSPRPSSGINESGLAAQENPGTASTPGLTRTRRLKWSDSRRSKSRYFIEQQSGTWPFFPSLSSGSG
jgi:hypothetical protein